MPTWVILMDRRRRALDEVWPQLVTLAAAIDDLTLSPSPALAFEQADDGGAFRDFVPIGTCAHPAEEALDVLAELLLERFGWDVDMRPDVP